MPTGDFAWVGLAAAIPITIVLLVIFLRGYDVTLVIRKRGKDE
jgi:hypothetical protein